MSGRAFRREVVSYRRRDDRTHAVHAEEPIRKPVIVSFDMLAGAGSMAIILVVENQEQVRVLAESVLQGSGHQTLSAASVDQALALLRAEQSIEFLFTDINLADDVEAGLVHPGLELAQQALRLRPALRVLYTTGAGVTDGMKALFVEGSDFLAKPYDINQLSAKVAEMVSR
jgi:DNA-binding NtrC family response regulator